MRRIVTAALCLPTARPVMVLVRPAAAQRLQLWSSVCRPLSGLAGSGDGSDDSDDPDNKDGLSIQDLSKVIDEIDETRKNEDWEIDAHDQEVVEVVEVEAEDGTAEVERIVAESMDGVDERALSTLSAEVAPYLKQVASPRGHYTLAPVMKLEWLKWLGRSAWGAWG